jgi:hypothetical protein
MKQKQIKARAGNNPYKLKVRNINEVILMNKKEHLIPQRILLHCGCTYVEDR